MRAEAFPRSDGARPPLAWDPEAESAASFLDANPGLVPIGAEPGAVAGGFRVLGAHDARLVQAALERWAPTAQVPSTRLATAAGLLGVVRAAREVVARELAGRETDTATEIDRDRLGSLEAELLVTTSAMDRWVNHPQATGANDITAAMAATAMEIARTALELAASTSMGTADEGVVVEWMGATHFIGRFAGPHSALLDEVASGLVR